MVIKWLRSLFGKDNKEVQVVPSSARPITRYLEEDAIVNDIIRNMSDADQKVWKSVQQSELGMWNPTTGLEIRNKYLLWDVDNPFTNATIADDEKHPDQLSARVIRKVWQVVNA